MPTSLSCVFDRGGATASMNQPGNFFKRSLTMTADRNFYRSPNRVYPVVERTQGIYVYDEQGREFIDFGSGIGVTGIGGGVEQVIDKMTAQLHLTTFVFNGYFTNRPRIELSQKLLQLCPHPVHSFRRVGVKETCRETKTTETKISTKNSPQTNRASCYCQANAFPAGPTRCEPLRSTAVIVRRPDRSPLQ